MTTMPTWLLAGLFAVAPSVADAAMPPYPPPMESDEIGSAFDALDRNADGALEQDELPANHELSASFAQHDADADARLSRSEYDAYLGGAVAQADDDEDDATEYGEPPAR